MSTGQKNFNLSQNFDLSRNQSPVMIAEGRRSSSRSRSPRRSISSRSLSRSRTPNRSPSSRGGRGRRNGVRGQKLHSESLSRSPSRSRSRSRSRVRGERRHRSQSHSRDRSPGPKSSKIVVEKLTKNVNENHLREIFGVYGPIRDLDMPMNRQFMTNRGTAYILYTTTSDAEAAIAHMHEAQLDGAIINVSIVLPRRQFSRSPPPARRAGPGFERYEPRGGPQSAGFRGPPLGPGGVAGPRYRSPPPARRSPPRRYGRGDARGRDLDTYRPRSYSRSRSPYPRRTRSRSFSSRSPSRTRGARRGYGGGRRDSPPRGGRRRRSPSYSSYSSYSERSRSRSRDRRGGRR